MIKKIKNKLAKDINLNELLKGSAITFGLKMSGMALSFFVMYLISKRLGSEGVGFYNLFFQILTVLGMTLGLGMKLSVLRYVGQFNNDKLRSNLHLIYKYFIRIVGPISLIFGLIIFLTAHSVSQYLGKNNEFEVALKCIGLILPFFTLNQINVEFIRGLRKLKISELIRSVLRPLIISVLILIFRYDSMEKIDTIFVLTFALLVNFIVSNISIRKELNKIPYSSSNFSKSEFVKTSLPMMITTISSVMISAIPIFLLEYFISQSEVGIFSITFRISGLVSLSLVIVNTVAAPKFSELYWSKKMNDLQKMISQSAKIMFWIALLIGLVLIIWSEEWLGLFGEEFRKGKIALIILVISQLINASTGSVGILMNMSGHQKKLRNIIVTASIISFCIYIILIPLYGIIGAAIGCLISNILVNITAVIFVHRKMNLLTFYFPFRKD
jgi:O-antigen/teichoic acid export membrane protein